MDITNLISALVEAQTEIQNATFDKTNPHFKSSYASFESVVSAVKPALNKNGIFYLLKSVERETGVQIETIFYGHGAELSSGQIFIPADKQTPQAFGSALTYAKRYSLATACGIGSDVDDDGNIAEDTSAKAKPKKPTKTEKAKVEAQLAQIGKEPESGYEQSTIIKTGLENSIVSEKTLTAWFKQGVSQADAESKIQKILAQQTRDAVKNGS